MTPAYAETFAHPLVEAMASGLPGDCIGLGGTSGICGEAADYFPRFAPQSLAQRIMQVCGSPRTKGGRCVKRECSAPEISVGTSMWHELLLLARV